MNKQARLNTNDYIFKMGDKFSKFFEKSTKHEGIKNEISYVCRSSNYLNYALVKGKDYFVDFYFCFPDKNSYANIAPILEKDIPFDLSYPNTVIKCFEASFNKMFKPENYFPFKEFEVSNWIDFMPGKRKIKFSSDFGLKNTLKYKSFNNRKINLVISTKLGAFIKDKVTSESAVFISIPTNSQYSSKMKFIVSAVANKPEIHLINKDHLQVVTLEEIIQMFEDAVNVSTFNCLNKVLGESMYVKKRDFKNLDDSEKETLIDLSKMISY